MSTVKLNELSINAAPLKMAVSAHLTVDVDMIDVTSVHGHTVADPRWTHVDTMGHWHAATRKVGGQRDDVFYPTLEEHVELNPAYDPDDPDPDWTVNAPNLRWRRCVICHERVDPGTTTSHLRQYVAGPVTWQINVEVADPSWLAPDRSGQLYTVRGLVYEIGMHPRRREWFGVARWRPAGVINPHDGYALVTGTFEGVGDLGERVG